MSKGAEGCRRVGSLAYRARESATRMTHTTSRTIGKFLAADISYVLLRILIPIVR
jgi:hypothetical protein